MWCIPEVLANVLGVFDHPDAVECLFEPVFGQLLFARSWVVAVHKGRVSDLSYPFSYLIPLGLGLLKGVSDAALGRNRNLELKSNVLE